MSETPKVIPFSGLAYDKEDLLEMNPTVLRALLRERTHHTIEVPIYAILARGQTKAVPNFGLQAQMVYDVWKERGFTEHDPDIEWIREYLSLAQKIREGEGIEWTTPVPAAFTEEEMAVVHKLLYERRSVRDWMDKPVPDEMINEILEAGRAAPIGCNLDEVRFVVIRDPEEARMVWSDISTKNAVLIVICVDKRIPPVVGQDKSVPHNAGFDAAAAADHMLLMAHALGLGAVWLSKSAKSEVTEDTGKKFREKYGLPDYIEPELHIAVGWPAMGTIKSKRMPLSEMMLTKGV